MARFFDPQQQAENQDNRLHAPATARNRAVILAALQPALPPRGLIFEVASGTGEHAAFIAPQLSGHQWQPTDIEDHHLKSIDAWRHDSGAANILPAQHFNVMTDNFQNDVDIAAILAINLIHIAPWAVAEALIEKAGKRLTARAILFLYGPYKQKGAHTSGSNEAFDQSLKANNPAWGVRDMESVIALATEAGFEIPDIIPMPANNFSLIFKKK